MSLANQFAEIVFMFSMPWFVAKIGLKRVVAIGMLAATRLSESRGLCQRGLSARLGELLQRFGLPREIPADLDRQRILDAMKLDKKVLAGSIRLILVQAAGQGIIDDRSDAQQICDAIDACKAG